MIGRATAVGEDTQAIARFTFGLTLGVGAMAAVAGALTGQATVVVGAPSLVLAVALSWWRGDGLPSPIAGWAGAAVWLGLATVTTGDTILVPLAMVALCLTLAFGPERVGAWLARQARTQPDAEPGVQPPAGEDAAPGWIEEDGRRV